MHQSRLSSLAALACALVLPATARAAVLVRASSSAGMMQVPTSHYYYAIYGGQVDVGTASEGFLVRMSYLERPEFRAAGFADKDYGGFAAIGTKVTKAKDHGLYAFIGGGRMIGYIRALNADATSTDSTKVRSYSLPGPTAMLEYSAQFNGLQLGIGHQTFIGYVDDTQLKAYVAWPYNFFQATVGYSW